MTDRTLGCGCRFMNGSIFPCDDYGHALNSVRALLDELDRYGSKLDAERKLASGYYGEAQEGWSKFRTAESRIKELELEVVRLKELEDVELELLRCRLDEALETIRILREVGDELGGTAFRPLQHDFDDISQSTRCKRCGVTRGAWVRGGHSECVVERRGKSLSEITTEAAKQHTEAVRAKADRLVGWDANGSPVEGNPKRLSGDVNCRWCGGNPCECSSRKCGRIVAHVNDQPLLCTLPLDHAGTCTHVRGEPIRV